LLDLGFSGLFQYFHHRYLQKEFAMKKSLLLTALLAAVAGLSACSQDNQSSAPTPAPAPAASAADTTTTEAAPAATDAASAAVDAASAATADAAAPAASDAASVTTITIQNPASAASK
jgi:predicted lipid-binding transport protein (Tim44 family)